jgi:hypothetical protein
MCRYLGFRVPPAVLLASALLLLLITEAGYQNGALQAEAQSEGVCDPDGVHAVSWGLETEDERVHSVDIVNIDAACTGADLFVDITKDGETIAASSANIPTDGSPQDADPEVDEVGVKSVLTPQYAADITDIEVVIEGAGILQSGSDETLKCDHDGLNMAGWGVDPETLLLSSVRIHDIDPACAHSHLFVNVVKAGARAAGGEGFISEDGRSAWTSTSSPTWPPAM